MKSVLTDPAAYDWEGDTPLCHPAARTIIYEILVGEVRRKPMLWMLAIRFSRKKSFAFQQFSF